MSRRVHLEDVLGPFIKREGQEEKFVCLNCNCKCLHVNKEKGLFHCLSCGISGRLIDDELADIRIEKPNPKKILRGKDFSYWLDVTGMNTSWRFVGRKNFSLERCTKESLKLCGGDYFLKGICVPLVLDEELCGVHCYTPEYPYSRKYFTQGERGFAKISTNQYDLFHIFLFEGLFDFLNFDNFLRTTKILPIGYTLLMSCGSFLSQEQIYYLSNISQSDSTIYICFDNDKITPVTKAYQQIRTLIGCNTKILIPPRQKNCKDWDELLTQVPLGIDVATQIVKSALVIE